MRAGVRGGLEALAGILVLGAAVLWLSGGCQERVAPQVVDVPGTSVPDVEVVAVESQLEPALEWASGEVASARHVVVSSRVLARIDAVRVRAGSPVSEGDVLVVLDARDLAARAGETEQALRAAQARLELAQRESQRVEELFRTGVAAERRLDEVRAQLRAARADVAGATQSLEEARTGASYAEIRSPVSGRVVDRLAEPGDTAVPGRPLLRIYDPSLLRVEVPVRESLAVGLTVGDALRVEIPALGQPVEGHIDEIVPFAEPGARTLLVKVSLPRSDARLFAGMFARVAIPAGERQRLLVPAAAVERVGQLEFVDVLGGDGRAERRLVTTGAAASADRVEVLSGLREGERVAAGAR